LAGGRVGGWWRRLITLGEWSPRKPQQRGAHQGGGGGGGSSGGGVLL